MTSKDSIWDTADEMFANCYKFAGHIDRRLQRVHEYTMNAQEFCLLVEIFGNYSSTKAQFKVYKELIKLPTDPLLRRMRNINAIFRIYSSMKGLTA